MLPNTGKTGWFYEWFYLSLSGLLRMVLPVPEWAVLAAEPPEASVSGEGRIRLRYLESLVIESIGRSILIDWRILS